MSQSETDGDEQPEAQPVYPQRGPDREEMVANYLPEGEDWPAKTILDLNDPAAVAALSQFGELFPEVDDLQQPIDDFLSKFLKSRTSVSGKSREEYRSIIEHMYGRNSSDEKRTNAIMTALGADIDDD